MRAADGTKHALIRATVSAGSTALAAPSRIQPANRDLISFDFGSTDGEIGAFRPDGSKVHAGRPEPSSH
jgi:hypothetical protein